MTSKADCAPRDLLESAWKKEVREMTIIGIDPGAKGGIAFLSPDKLDAIVMPMAGKELDISTIVNTISYFDVELAVVEKCHTRPEQGVVSSGKFMKGYGVLLGILGALKISTMLVTHQAWKKVILAGTAKDKDAAIAYVNMKYPNFKLILPRCRKPHDGMADAICIAEYGRGKFLNEH